VQGEDVDTIYENGLTGAVWIPVLAFHQKGKVDGVKYIGGTEVFTIEKRYYINDGFFG
jgi:hypothetical protein